MYQYGDVVVIDKYKTEAGYNMFSIEDTKKRNQFIRQIMLT